MSRAQVAKDLVASQAKALKMPGLLRVYDDLARQAREERWGYEEYLREVLMAESTSRQRPTPARCGQSRPLSVGAMAALVS